MCTTCMPGDTEVRRGHWIPWDWSYVCMVLSLQVGAVNQTRALSKSSTCSYQLSHFSSPKSCFEALAQFQDFSQLYHTLYPELDFKQTWVDPG